ncbi:MAG: glycosyltransferase family 4 protein [Candidatus Erginobacter occultus]|nr:glycosyltransferase family 4 protein [Candidatus Erginobacter occultus]
MKVFVLGTRGFPGVQGGVEKHCEELYPRLVRQAAEITVFTRTPYIPRRERRKRWEGIRFIHLWSPKTKSLEAITHTLIGVVIARYCSPDILHVHAVGPSICIPLAKVLGLKVVMTHHGPDYEREKWGRAAKAVLKLGEYLGTRFADRIIAISRGIAGSLEKRVRANERVFYIPNGVRIPEVLPAGETLRRLRLEPRGYVFTACRFVPEKGLHDLIRAYQKIKNPEFKLVIAGDADHENDYSRMIKQLARESSGVVLSGAISGMPLRELFSQAGLFVLASYYEGLPIALLEALSYGLPVLASDIPQNREIPLPEFRYFEPGNSEVLASKMVKLFEAGIDQAEEVRQKDYLTANHNWDILARETYQVYRSMVDQD